MKRKYIILLIKYITYKIHFITTFILLWKIAPEKYSPALKFRTKYPEYRKIFLQDPSKIPWKIILSLRCVFQGRESVPAGAMGGTRIPAGLRGSPTARLDAEGPR